jgi:hypothetical protein
MSGFYKIAERYPPVLVRLLARNGGKAMTNEEIADSIEFTAYRIQLISEQRDWSNLSFNECKLFTAACNLDFTSRKDINRIECYLRKNNGRPSFKYLTSSPGWKTYYFPLLINWRKSLTTIPITLPKPIQRLLASLPTK